VTEGVAAGVSGSSGEVDSVVVTAVDITGTVTGPGGAGSGSAALVELNATVSTVIAPTAAVPIMLDTNLIRIEATSNNSLALGFVDDAATA
jgi:hypothetical protein